MTLFSGALSLLACARTTGRSPADDQVYAAALDSLYPGNASSGTLFIQDSTSCRPWVSDSPETYIACHRSRLPGVDARTMRLLLASGSESLRLPEHLPIRRPYTWIRTTDVRRIGTFQAGWDSFTREHPGNPLIARLSSIVYSKDGQRALLYETSMCPGLCGGGAFVALRRNAAAWLVVGISGDWAS